LKQDQRLDLVIAGLNLGSKKSWVLVYLVPWG